MLRRGMEIAAALFIGRRGATLAKYLSYLVTLGLTTDVPGRMQAEHAIPGTS